MVWKDMPKSPFIPVKAKAMRKLFTIISIYIKNVKRVIFRK
jgi:hypothetical protein